MLVTIAVSTLTPQEAISMYYALLPKVNVTALDRECLGMHLRDQISSVLSLRCCVCLNPLLYIAHLCTFESS